MSNVSIWTYSHPRCKLNIILLTGQVTEPEDNINYSKINEKLLSVMTFAF